MCLFTKMSIFLICILMCGFSEGFAMDNFIDGTELELSFMISRHGDRTPVHESLYIIRDAVDVDKVDEMVAPWGYGQLTNEGKLRGYKTGLFIRRRYNDLLSRRYNLSEIYIRSTDANRAKMTVLTAMTAVYPAVGETWSASVDWVPVPYTTLPPKYDYFFYHYNCPTYMEVNKKVFSGPSASMTKKYSDLLEKLTQISGTNFTKYPTRTYAAYDAFVSLDRMGYKLAPEILELMPELSRAAGDAIEMLYAPKDYLNLVSGQLLQEFFTEAAKIMAGQPAQRVRVYSTHDLNVFGFEMATGVVDKQGVPGYGALYALELRRVVATGEFVVLPVYLTSPDEPETYLRLEGCPEDSFLCPYETFYHKTSSRAITEAEWRRQCDWSEDLVLDADVI